jgi:oligopeptide/dipeptide ABC transporter ATP-binding protein
VQKQILDLFDQLRRERGLSVLLVSHDLTLVAERCHTVSVMYAGRVVEHGPAKDLFRQPHHPYTGLLEAARPRLENKPHSLLRTIPGTVPDLHRLPAGCSFADRCPQAADACRTTPIGLARTGAEREAACLFPTIPVPSTVPVPAVAGHHSAETVLEGR